MKSSLLIIFLFVGFEPTIDIGPTWENISTNLAGNFGGKIYFLQNKF